MSGFPPFAGGWWLVAGLSACSAQVDGWWLVVLPKHQLWQRSGFVPAASSGCGGGIDQAAPADPTTTEAVGSGVLLVAAQRSPVASEPAPSLRDRPPAGRVERGAGSCAGQGDSAVQEAEEIERTREWCAGGGVLCRFTLAECLPGNNPSAQRWIAKRGAACYGGL